MARGDFSATALGRISARLNTLFKGERYNAQLNLPYDVLKAMLERQTASFATINEGGICRGVKATYLKDCVDTTLTCIGDDILTACKVVGNQVESVSANFDVNDCLQDGVTVYDDECDNNEIKADELTAFGLAKVFAKFRKALETKAVAFLDSNATDFDGITLPYGAVDGTDTTEVNFDPDKWSASIVGQLQWLADQYGVYEAFMLDSGNLWLDDWMNKFRSDGCCKIDSLGGNAIDLVYGTKTISQTTSKASTFLVDPNSYAFWTRNYYNSLSPVPMQDENNSFVFKIPVPGLQYASNGNLYQVYADAIRQRQCEITSGRHRWKTVTHLKLHFAFNLGPDICSTGETGIIHTVNRLEVPEEE